MRAITVLPGIACSARLEEVAEPAESDGPVLVRTLALGVCGTDREILGGSYGFAPPGQQRLVLGHELLGVVETAPDGCGLAPGDLVVGVVRRPDPEPCVACAVGEWDMCRNGRYTERGIKERHGYGAERFRIEPEFAIKIDPELGHSRRAAGARQHPREGLGPHRAHRTPGARVAAKGIARHRRGSHRPACRADGECSAASTCMCSITTRAARRRRSCAISAVRITATRARWNGWRRTSSSSVREPQPLSALVSTRRPRRGIVCLTGVSEPAQDVRIRHRRLQSRPRCSTTTSCSASVNANRRHYEMAADALARADKAWLGRLITRQCPARPLERGARASQRRHQGDHRLRT